jgi:hypothetical protein
MPKQHCQWREEKVKKEILSEKSQLTASGHAPKKPPQNLQSMTVCRSFATATPIWKMENPNIEMTMGSRRPLSSDRGAHIVGP